MTVTHLRVHIFPHGGVNRLRFFGHARDTPAEARALAAFHQHSDVDASELLHSFCGAGAFVSGMLARRPFPDVRALFSAAEEVWWSLPESALLEAFAAHPKIGEQTKAATQTAQSATWSSGEQNKVAQAGPDELARLADFNQKYFNKFGFIFIVFASGRTTSDILQILESRIDHARAEEIENAAREQARITRLRMEKWLRAAVTANRRT